MKSEGMRIDDFIQLREVIENRIQERKKDIEGGFNCYSKYFLIEITKTLSSLLKCFNKIQDKESLKFVPSGIEIYNENGYTRKYIAYGTIFDMFKEKEYMDLLPGRYSYEAGIMGMILGRTFKELEEDFNEIELIKEENNMESEE